ncbi:hypothetical protein [Paraburkholderia sp. BCC1884]|uniref:hypothetical protein n=1 Tax=Paraburkholderia sp. BCC1884 TaxID=2562668 RepID=UPI001183078F|nr:hypothetical protein [Paraburkholderia sp. BCC1884]
MSSNDAVMCAAGTVSAEQQAAEFIAKVSARDWLPRVPHTPSDRQRGPRVPHPDDTSRMRSMSVSEDKESWVHLHAANVRALGPLGAIMFDYVSQWSRASKKGGAQLAVKDCHGEFWLACSYARIEQDTGLKKRDAERGLADCVEAGALEATTMKYARKRCLHVRIAPANGAQITPWPLIVGDVTGERPKSLCVLKNDSQAPGRALLTDQSTGACFPNTTSILSTAIRNTTGESVPASPGQQPAPPSLAKGKKAPKPQGDNPASPVPLAPSKPVLAIAVQWETLTGERINGAAAKRLRDAMTAMHRKGIDYNAVVVWAVDNWTTIKWKVDPRDTRSPSLDRPRVDYFVAHWPEAHEAMLARNPARQQAPTARVIPMHPPTITKAASTPRDEVSLDTHLGTIAELDAILATKK